MSTELSSHSVLRNPIDSSETNDGRRRKPFNPIRSLKKFFGTGGGGGGGGGGGTSGVVVGSSRIRTLSGGADRSKDPDLSTLKAHSTTDVLGAVAADIVIHDEMTVGSCSWKQLSLSADSVFSSSVGLSVARESVAPISINNTSTDSLSHLRPKDEQLMIESESKEGGLLKGYKAEEDEGHPRSPLTLATTADIITENNGQLNKNKWPSFDSGHSLLSVEDSSENEQDDQDIFKDKWQTPGGSNQPKLRTGSEPSDIHQEMDFSVVCRHTSLKSSAVAHRLAVKPKNKRMSAAYQLKMQAFAATQKQAEFIEILPELDEEVPAVDKATEEEIIKSKNLAAEAAKLILRRTAVKESADTEASSGAESMGVVRRALKDPSLTSEERNSRRQTIAISSEVSQSAESKVIKRSSIHVSDKPRSTEQTETMSELTQIFSRIQRKSSQRQNEKPEVSVKPGSSVSLPAQQMADDDKLKKAADVLESTGNKAHDSKVSNHRSINDGIAKVEVIGNGIDLKTDAKLSKAKEVDSSSDSRLPPVCSNFPKKDSAILSSKMLASEQIVKLPDLPKVENTAAVSSANITSGRSRVDPAVRIEPVPSGQSAATEKKSNSAFTDTAKSQDKIALGLAESKSKEKSATGSGSELQNKSKLIHADGLKSSVDGDKGVAEKPKPHSVATSDLRNVNPHPLKRNLSGKRPESEPKSTAVTVLKQDESRNSLGPVSIKKSNSISYKATSAAASESGHSKTCSVSITDRHMSLDSSLSSGDKIEVTKVSPPCSAGPGKTPGLSVSDDRNAKTTADIKNTALIRDGSTKSITPSNQRVVPVGPSIKPSSSTAAATQKAGLQLKSSLSVKPSDNLPVIVSAVQPTSMSKSLDSAELCRSTAPLTTTASTVNVSTDLRRAPSDRAAVSSELSVRPAVSTAATSVSSAATAATKVKPAPTGKPKAEPEWFAMARQKTREWSEDKL